MGHVWLNEQDYVGHLTKRKLCPQLGVRGGIRLMPSYSPISSPLFIHLWSKSFVPILPASPFRNKPKCFAPMTLNASMEFAKTYECHCPGVKVLFQLIWQRFMVPCMILMNYCPQSEHLTGTWAAKYLFQVVGPVRFASRILCCLWSNYGVPYRSIFVHGLVHFGS